jgi:hypothetical protein
MSEKACTYNGNREEALVAFLYNDMAPDERRVFEAHTGTCLVCRSELAALGAIRATLQEWTPPDIVHTRLAKEAATTGRPGLWSSLRKVPTWAQVAAAALVLGVAAGMANLEVNVGPDRLLVRTGWSAEPDTRAGVQPAANMVSREELAALEADLSRQIREVASLNQQLVAANAAAQAEGVLRRVQGLVSESEKKQQTELALRLATFSNDVQARRNEDLRTIGWNLAKYREDTNIEVQRTRSALETVALLVNQQR